MSSKLNVAIAQWIPVIGDKEKNALRIVEGMRKGAKADADIVIFPELFLTGYSCRDYFHNLAEDPNSRIFRQIVRESNEYNVGVVFGAPIRDKDRKIIYNSLVFINGDNIGVYNKINLANFGPFEEKMQFAHGDDAKLFNIGNIKFAPVICYDAFFPELLKSYALGGAHVIIHISASPYFSKQAFETIVPARAVENTVFYIFCNYVGVERGLVFWGGSRVISPRGYTIAKAKEFEEDFISCTINLDELRIARFLRPTIRDS